MSDSFEVVGFVGAVGQLVQWRKLDCKQWRLVGFEERTLFSHRGEFCCQNQFAASMGELAQAIPPRKAAELLLGSGFELPTDLLKFVSSQYVNPKTERCKKRPKPKRVKACQGLSEFLKTSSRMRDHGTRKGRTTNADSLENQKSDDDSVPPKSGE